MTTTFSGPSRLANLRQKKNSQQEEPLNSQGQLKLTLPEQDEKAGYEPSSTFSNTRTSMRLLKGKIDRGQSSDKQQIRSNNTLQSQPGSNQRLTLLETKEDLKLVLNDEPIIIQKKIVQEPTAKPPQKRIMIAKQPSKQQPIIEPPPSPPKQEEPSKHRKHQPLKEQPKQEKQQYNNPHDEKPIIKEQQVEESQQQPENQNDLVLCPEGCGRKFNRKALEKHAKACKIVFMSKRKEFNSQAKRLASKQQANLVKQNKMKQKNQLGKTKTKGFEKTGDNWKAASEDFRAAIKAIKKDDKDGQEQQQDDADQGEQGNEKQAALKLIACEFCQKMFAQVLIEKHLENCLKKKQKEKQKKKSSVVKKK